MGRLTLRRGLHVPDYSKPPKHAQTPVKFVELAMHEVFTLRPGEYVNIGFIKTADRVAEVESWDDRVQLRQSFAADTMVYPIRRATKPPYKPKE